MERMPSSISEHLASGEALFLAHAVGEVLFARGTYQVHVVEGAKKKGFFPFLQFQDDGHLTDSFCTCQISEAGHGCPHLTAAYLRIFNGQRDPLHVRFIHSLWNSLFRVAARRYGCGLSALQKEGESYRTDGLLIECKTAFAMKKLGEIVAQKEETEETSLKFSELSPEELRDWREGRGNEGLRYELSFWSDLAKWLMALQDEEQPYEISFIGTGLPSEIVVSFPQVKVVLSLARGDWPLILPAIHSVQCPLPVFDSGDEAIIAMRYDEQTQTLLIQRGGEEGQGERGMALGEGWYYVSGKGFFRRKADSLLPGEAIGPDQLGEALTRGAKIVQKFLPLDTDPIQTQYSLRFDNEKRLYIQMYLFEPGDLRSEGAALFYPWVYLPKKGFFLLKEPLFSAIETVIEQDKVAPFINQHRLWLHHFPGFQVHLGSLEAHLTYELTGEGRLNFGAKLDYPDPFEETADFDEWVYIKGQGFYMKKESRGRLPLHPGLSIAPEEIANFIAAHQDDLEQVEGFFSADCPIAKSGLFLTLTDDKKIAVQPKMEYVSGVEPGRICYFGDYLYERGKGFCLIPLSLRLPERYRQPLVIPSSQEAAFLAYELEPLKPWILEMDPRLKKPHHLQLKIRKIIRDKRNRGKQWLIDLVYESEYGLVDIFSIWDAFQERERHLFSPAGFLSLKEPRYNWIRQLQKRRLDRKRGMIRMNTVEWIRLSVFENIQTPKGPDAQETEQLLKELASFETHRLLDISRLKATLRPYQEIGLNWLWFLYCHGLSGLLCDDMGLGKTHQAMALLAAVSHEDPDKNYKYLVVCPTSVIYHWQELLSRFLPEMKVCTYYGLARSLDRFETDYDVLLTSYGILRTGRDDLRSFKFELAYFDEIQVAKNQSSQTHAALSNINARMRLGLTGTPIENRIRELKSLFDIVLPGYMPPDAVFRELFVQPIEKYQDEEKKALLTKLVKPFILRRKKSEVLLDLPEKIEEISYCDLSEEQKKLYRDVAIRMRETLYFDLQDPAKPVPYIHVFSALSTLKQICDHPSLIEGTAKEYMHHQSGKWDLFIQLLDAAREGGQKVVVFSQYLDMLSIIEAHLKKQGIGFASIKGSTRDRSEQLKRFKEDPACEVFVASLLAAGVGIDLTVASIVIHYDRWWNPAKENQATDRVHRIGQNRGVQVFKLVTKHTIEEHIHTLIEKKKGLMEEIIGQDDADQINYLSREELLAIFDKMFREVY